MSLTKQEIRRFWVYRRCFRFTDDKFQFFQTGNNLRRICGFDAKKRWQTNQKVMPKKSQNRRHNSLLLKV